MKMFNLLSADLKKDNPRFIWAILASSVGCRADAGSVDVGGLTGLDIP